MHHRRRCPGGSAGVITSEQATLRPLPAEPDDPIVGEVATQHSLGQAILERLIDKAPRPPEACACHREELPQHTLLERTVRGACVPDPDRRIDVHRPGAG